MSEFLSPVSVCSFSCPLSPAVGGAPWALFLGGRTGSPTNSPWARVRPPVGWSCSRKHHLLAHLPLRCCKRSLLTPRGSATEGGPSSPARGLGHPWLAVDAAFSARPCPGLKLPGIVGRLSWLKHLTAMAWTRGCRGPFRAGLSISRALSIITGDAWGSQLVKAWWARRDQFVSSLGNRGHVRVWPQVMLAGGGRSTPAPHSLAPGRAMNGHVYRP